MPLTVAVQMDPIGSINPKSDSTLLLMREAQARGHALHYYTPADLSWRDGKITARSHRIKVFTDPAHYYELGAASLLDLETADVVLLRQDPPFNMAYLSTTYLLEMLKRPLVVNNPSSVARCPEKIFPAMFGEFMPPTLISASRADITAFIDDYGDAVVKPLYGFGGEAVFRLKKGDVNINSVLDTVFAGSAEPIIAQKFLPEIAGGDRRIIFIDGRVAGVVARHPAEGEIRANLRLGGRAAKAELTPRQKKACDAIGPELKKRGLLFAGVDMIGDWLTEINLTSPTTLVAANALYGIRLEAEIWDAIERYLP